MLILITTEAVIAQLTGSQEFFSRQHQRPGRQVDASSIRTPLVRDYHALHFGAIF